MQSVKFIRLYRILSKILPLKQRLNFLIKAHLGNNDAIVIPYYDRCNIVIRPRETSRDTISDLIFDGACYLPEFSIITKLKKRLPSEYTYVDVGSNIGTTIWLFSRKAKKVYAFEPIPHLYNTIVKSIAVNQAENIVLVQKAIGNECGEITMSDNNNSSVLLDKTANSLSIPVSTLDQELAAVDKIHLIKIDVEGFELKVLQGASQVITKHRPILLIELHPGFIKRYGDSSESVLDFLEQYGYSITYYSFLDNLRMSKGRRLISRWLGTSGRQLSDKRDFLNDTKKMPELSSYHLYCEPAIP